MNIELIQEENNRESFLLVNYIRALASSVHSYIRKLNIYIKTLRILIFKKSLRSVRNLLDVS